MTCEFQWAKARRCGLTQEYGRSASIRCGAKVEELRLTLPNRESAIHLHDRAESMGASQTLYMDNRRTLWNPFPAGLWIEE
jgi:hypothetical protein